jgi:hypothetical protein
MVEQSGRVWLLDLYPYVQGFESHHWHQIDAGTRGQFHQHFWCQSSADFAQFISDVYNGSIITQKYAKIWCSVQKLWLKTCNKILAEMLVKHNSIFCAIYFIYAPLRITQVSC